MEKIKKYLISLGISLGLIIVFAFFINILNYFELINTGAYKTILILLAALSIFVGAFLLGKKASQKGYLEGLKFGLITCLLMLIISYLAFDSNISIDSLIYYIILLFTSCTGSMIGINKKTLDQNN